MGWFGRAAAPEADPAPPPPEALPSRTLPWEEGAAPGLAAFLEGLEVGRGLAVLDLGSATPEAFRLYRPMARSVRFLGPADSSVRAPEPEAPSLGGVPGPFDLFLLWDVLDRLPPEGRGGFVTRLAQVAAPGARMHLVARSSAEAPRSPIRFVPLEGGRLRQAPGPGTIPRHPLLLPAEVNRVLEPFRVQRGFVLRGGLREYVATLPRGAAQE